MIDFGRIRNAAESAAQSFIDNPGYGPEAPLPVQYQNTTFSQANSQNSGQKQGSAEPPQLKAGKEAHNAEEVRPGEKAEARTPSGKRMDRYNEEKGHIREIKPDNARGERSGQKQLAGYKDEMEQAIGRPHTTELTKYPKRPTDQ